MGQAPSQVQNAPAAAGRESKRALEPIDRILEVLFGLIMVLTFTGSLSAAESGRAEVRAMLVGALGCNLAWGLIDAIMYLMTCMVERGQQLRTVLAVRAAATAEAGWRLISDAVPPMVAAALSATELENVRLHINRLPEPRAAVTIRFALATAESSITRLGVSPTGSLAPGPPK